MGFNSAFKGLNVEVKMSLGLKHRKDVDYRGHEGKTK
jgi:hypothetical protein